MLIAVTCDRRSGLAGPGPNERPSRHEVWVSEHVIDHLRAVGLTPILLPPGGTEIDLVMGVVSGVVVTGGAFDIHPSHYGESISASRIDRVDEARTGLELAMVRECRRRRTPLLGICGGMQAMAVALGAGLIQDLQEHARRTGMPLVEHEQTHDPAFTGHEIVCSPGWEWLGREVNSTHHQAVNPEKLGAAQVVALAPDGTIEAIICKEAPMLGVEWHPELVSAPGSCEVFAAFANVLRGGAYHPPGHRG